LRIPTFWKNIRDRGIMNHCIAAVILAFVVSPLYSQSDTISGLVVAVDGTPMAGVPVKATPEGTNSAGLPTIATQTDSAGRYHFEGVPSGTYLLRAGPDGGSGITLHTIIVTSARLLLSDFGVDPVTGNLTLPSARSMMTQTPILIGPARITIPDSTSSGFDIAILPSAVTVSGHLVTPPGMTLPELRANLTSSVSQLTMDTNVHADGTFEISSVPPGKYVLRIIPNLGISPETITVTDHNQNGIELGGKASGVQVTGNVLPSDRAPYQDTLPQWVYLVGQDATEVSPSMQTSLFGAAFLPISDPARLQPPPPITFADTTGTAIEAPFAPVGSDGRFEFLSVAAGDYYVRTWPEMGVPNFPITVVGDKDLDNVHVGVGVRVRGELVSLNLGTRPPELIRLTAVGFKGQSVSADVKADGSFEFPKVGPGTYRILLDNKIRPRPSEVTIGNEDLIFRVETPFKAWVAGRVVFAGPIPPAEILNALRVGMNNGFDSEVKPDGSFHIKSDEGEYEFFLKDLPEGCFVKSISDGTGNLMTEPVKVDLSSPPREILVTLEYKPAANPNPN
jgi:hypothetical protein